MLIFVKHFERSFQQLEIACYTSNTLTEFVMQVCQIKIR